MTLRQAPVIQIREVPLTDARVKQVLWWFETSCCVQTHGYDRALLATNRNGSPVGLLAFRQLDGVLDFSRAVHPRSRRKGIASRLLDHLIQVYPTHLLTCTSIHAWMQPWLESRGFSPDPRRSQSFGNSSFVRSPHVR